MDPVRFVGVFIVLTILLFAIGMTVAGFIGL